MIDKIKQSQFLIGVSLALLAALGISFKAIFVKLAYAQDPTIDAITVLTIRMLFAVPFFAFVALQSTNSLSSKLQGHDYLAVMSLGLLGYYLSAALDFSGLVYVSAGLERLIIYLYPIFVVILIAIVRRRMMNRGELIAALVCYIGISFAFFAEAKTNTPDFYFGATLVLLASISYSIYLVGSAKYISRLGANRYTSYSMLVSSVAIIIHYLIVNEVDLTHYDTAIYLYCFLIAIVSTVLPTFFMAHSIKYIGSSKMAIVSAIGPALTIIMADRILAEPVSMTQFIGMGFIVAGIFMVGTKKSS